MKSRAFIYFLLIASLASCQTAYKANKKRSAETRATIQGPANLSAKQKLGIDFFAEGNNPVAWTLGIDLEKGFEFNASGEKPLFAPPVAAVKNTVADRYEVRTDLGQMTVNIFHTACAPNEKPGNLNLNVEVTIRDKRYTGCGKYLYDANLNDIWTLEFIDQEKQQTGDYDGKLPWLEFDLAKNKMFGYDGCNNITGSIDVQGNRVNFGPFAGTKKSCFKNKAAKIFSEMISSQVIDYSIKENKLFLQLINDSKLTFVKLK